MLKRLVPVLFCLLCSVQSAIAQVSSFNPGAVIFGGTGRDGNITVSSNTAYTGPGVVKNAVDFTLNSSTTLTLDPHAPTIICARKSITINGTVTVTAGGFGGGRGAVSGATNGDCGAGPGGGSGTENTSAYGGGGGGSNQTRGGRGGAAASGFSCPPTGICPPSLQGGSGGGGAMSFGSATAGDGGRGGGCAVFLCNDTFTLAGTGVITCNGAAGSNSANSNTGGGGGGAGGNVIIASRKASGITTAASSVISTNGGNGGNGTGGGGGGGGGSGWQIFMCPGGASINGSAVNNFTAGSGGTGGQAGEAGASGGAILNLSRYPTWPLICQTLQDLDPIKHVCMAHPEWRRPGTGIYDVVSAERVRQFEHEVKLLKKGRKVA